MYIMINDMWSLISNRLLDTIGHVFAENNIEARRV